MHRDELFWKTSSFISLVIIMERKAHAYLDRPANKILQVCLSTFDHLLPPDVKASLCIEIDTETL